MQIARLLAALFLALGCAAARGAPAEESAPPMVSFADLYRMTAQDATGAGLGAASDAFDAANFSSEPQLRMAALQAPERLDPGFTVRPVKGPGRWMLLLAGLAAAAWVAHRRLAHAY